MSRALMRAGWVGIVTLTLLVAAVLRICQLNAFPAALSNDGAINVIDTFHIALTGNFLIYEEDEGRAEPLYRLVLAAAARLWGADV